jgi:hypothetical protein
MPYQEKTSQKAQKYFAGFLVVIKTVLDNET